MAMRAIDGGTRGGALQALTAQLAALWRRQHKRRSLSVRETAGLGERRFVAVVQFEERRFLIGGGPASVTLLAELAGEDPSEQP